MGSILVEGISVIDMIFATFFTIFLHFKTILQAQWVNWMIFFHQCVYILVLNHFIVGIFPIGVGLEIEFHLIMCF